MKAMKVFIDTNILIDVLARREPFFAEAEMIWSLAEKREIEAFISAISFNNVYYIVRKLKDRATAEKAIRLLRDVFRSVAPDEQIINQAIDAGMADFEDAVQFHSAVRLNPSYFITRDPSGFPRSPISIVAPGEFLAVFRGP